MVHCSAYNCFEDSRKRKSSGSLRAAAENASVTNDVSAGPSQSKTLFKFPSDPSLQKVWNRKNGSSEFELKTHSRLCQDYFEEDQFQVGPKIQSFPRTLRNQTSFLEKRCGTYHF